MTWYSNKQGSANTAEPMARCDKTGFIVPRKDLVREMEYNGVRLVWTGRMVSKHFADEPSPQLMGDIEKIDPEPVLGFGRDVDREPVASKLITEGYGFPASYIITQGFGDLT